MEWGGGGNYLKVFFSVFTFSTSFGIPGLDRVGGANGDGLKQHYVINGIIL